ncbi:MAG: DUF4269 domain-containing protein [Bacteroidota bacterium]
MNDFLTLDYLLKGNDRQRKAYLELQGLQLMERLAPYSPILVGTVPIGIDIPGSDLDVIVEVADFESFSELMELHYGSHPGFMLEPKEIRDTPCLVTRFQGSHFPIEVFGQAVPTVRQHAYRHMLVEHRILQAHGSSFRDEVVALKKAGHKTEPAFAKVLGLAGDPYEALLEWED